MADLEKVLLYDPASEKVSVIDSNDNIKVISYGGATSAKQDSIISQLQAVNSLIPSVWDYCSLTYTGSDLTGVVFKTGGSGGTVVSTLTLVYSSGNLTSVTKT